MTTSEFISKFKSRYLWGNLFAMLCVVTLLGLGVKYGIEIYTHHGESIAIPDLRHKKFADAEQILKNLDLQVVVSDTGYVKTLPPGCVLEQSPAAGERVKSGHIIYLTVNASHTPTLTLPDIIDNSSLREAMAKLTAMGFKLAMPQFVPGEKDWVYGVLVGGKSVVTGSKISVEDSLVIQVGNGMRDASDSVNYIDPIYPEEEDAIDEFEVMDNPTTTTDKPETQATEKKTTTTE